MVVVIINTRYYYLRRLSSKFLFFVYVSIVPSLTPSFGVCLGCGGGRGRSHLTPRTSCTTPQESTQKYLQFHFLPAASSSSASTLSGGITMSPCTPRTCWRKTSLARGRGDPGTRRTSHEACSRCCSSGVRGQVTRTVDMMSAMLWTASTGKTTIQTTARCRLAVTPVIRRLHTRCMQMTPLIAPDMTSCQLCAGHCDDVDMAGHIIGASAQLLPCDYQGEGDGGWVGTAHTSQTYIHSTHTQTRTTHKHTNTGHRDNSFCTFYIGLMFVFIIKLLMIWVMSRS